MAAPITTKLIPALLTAKGRQITTMNNYWEYWFATYNHHIAQMKQHQQENYWEKWFEVYAEKLKSIKFRT